MVLLQVPSYERGNFVGPTILCDVTTSMDCYKEEMSGPVLLCIQVDNLEEAMTIVSRQKCASGASIFTQSGFAARKFQNEVIGPLVGANVPYPIPLPFSSFTGSKMSVYGDLSFCVNDGVQFYTTLKTCAQQWLDLPTQRLPLHIPPISMADTSSQVMLLVQSPSTSQSDISSPEVSPGLPSASKIASQNVLLSSPPISEGVSPNPRSLSSLTPTTVGEFSGQFGAPHMPSTSQRASTNQEISLAMPPATENDFSVQEVPPFIPQNSNSVETLSLSRQMTENLLSTYEKTYLPLASSRSIENMASACQMMSIAVDHDSDSLSVPESHWNHIVDQMSTGNDSLGQNFQRTDINTHPTSENVFSPAASHRTDTTMHPNSGRFYFLPPQNGSNLMSLGTDTTLHPAERAYMPATSYRNDIIPSQMTYSTPPSSENMYTPSAIQRNDGLPLTSTAQGMYASTPQGMYASTSQGMYVSTSTAQGMYASTSTAQGMYASTPGYMGEYHGQGA